MNAAYLSTTSATGSSIAYSRFTIAGCLLMIGISFLLVRYWSLFSWRGQNTLLADSSSKHWAGATHEVFGRLKAPKGGVAPAQSDFCPRPNRMSRRAHPLGSSRPPFTEEVNRASIQK